MAGVRQRERPERGRRSSHADHGEIGRRVGADDRRAVGGAAGEADPDVGRALDDVVVGDDVAPRVDDEARAADLQLLGRRWVEERGRTFSVCVAEMTTTPGAASL
jgi:hypothetical protein